jgi:hypothetical protein
LFFSRSNSEQGKYQLPPKLNEGRTHPHSTCGSRSFRNSCVVNSPLTSSGMDLCKSETFFFVWLLGIFRVLRQQVTTNNNHIEPHNLQHAGTCKALPSWQIMAVSLLKDSLSSARSPTVPTTPQEPPTTHNHHHKATAGATSCPPPSFSLYSSLFRLRSRSLPPPPKSLVLF